jgi:hypothetical protein
MHSDSDPATEHRAAPPSRHRRARGNGPEGDGPVFVDTSGRRSRLLRRAGLLAGIVCLGYAVVLGMAFMGWGISSSPVDLLPFGGAQGEAGGPAPGESPGGAPPGAPLDGQGTSPAPTASGAPAQ